MGNMEKESESFCFKPIELLVLEVRWKNGKLNEYVPLVEKFIDVQQEEIKSRLGPEANDDILVRELLKLLLTNGTLDHASEMIQQKEEIMKECWIRAEQGDYDSSRITDEWIANHAPSWRRWRVMIYNLIAVKVAVDIYGDLDL
jgi:frataxin-like iron-binding protein CyaY